MKTPTIYQIGKAVEKKEIEANYLNGKDDKDDISYASYFAYCIDQASCVFAYHLMLGGHHNVNQEDKLVILEHLREISRVIGKYRQR